MKPTALLFAVASLLPFSLAFSPHDAAVIRDAHAQRDFLESRLATGEDLSTLEKRATGVTGSAYGFATGTTGGGSATPAYPSSRAQLVEWLEDSVARVILINSEQNFLGTEGTTTANGCRPASNTCGSSGQDAINQASWCTNGNAGSGSKTISVTYDNAAIKPINVGSNKSLVGVGSKASLKGKGLKIANGAKNVIIQNIAITDLNPSLIWGGDAITLNGADLVWIDHVKISLIGRQMFVSGYEPSRRVTISNSEFDGQTSWSAQCNGKHYWTIYFLGSSDLVTFDSNYVHHTSGRAPKVGGTILLHALNNYWYQVDGHAFDIIESGPEVIAEGNVFNSVTTPLLEQKGAMFTVPSGSESKCSAAFGRSCVANSLTSSGSFSSNDQGFLADYKSKSYIAPAAESASSVAAYVLAHAGVGKI